MVVVVHSIARHEDVGGRLHDEPRQQHDEDARHVVVGLVCDRPHLRRILDLDAVDVRESDVVADLHVVRLADVDARVFMAGRGTTLDDAVARLDGEKTVLPVIHGGHAGEQETVDRRQQDAVVLEAADGDVHEGEAVGAGGDEDADLLVRGVLDDDAGTVAPAPPDEFQTWLVDVEPLGVRAGLDFDHRSGPRRVDRGLN